MITGSGIVLLASIIGPDQVYAEPDPESWIAIIQANRTTWVASNLMCALGRLVTAAGALAIRTAVRLRLV